MDYTESTTEPSALVSLWKEDLWLDALLYSAATGGLLMALDKETEMIPTDSKERKDAPLYSGCMAYFPLALLEVARLSRAGNDKHNPGEQLHWSRDKSSDHADCIARHQLEFDTKDEDGFYHAVMVAWRALAQLQLLLEQDNEGPVIRFVPGEWPGIGWAEDETTSHPVDEIIGTNAYIDGVLQPKREGHSYYVPKEKVSKDNLFPSWRFR